MTCGDGRHGIEITPGVDAAVCAFDVETAAGARCRLVVGNVQIVCGDHPLEISERQQVVRRLADILLNYKSAGDLPVVRVIVGDNAMPSRGQESFAASHTDGPTVECRGIRT